jgi:arylsulfatase A-like enzyme
MGQPARRLAESVTRDAAAWVAQDPSRPFFLFLNYFDVHDPYTSEEPWRSQFSSKPSPGGRFDSTQSVLLADLTADQVHEEIDAYDGAISYVDHWIGELLASLERSGRLANTIVVLTSDHGEGLGQHGFMGHGTTLYAEQIHVPLILVPPAAFRPA